MSSQHLATSAVFAKHRHFETGSVVVGDGHESDPGGGDDVITKPLANVDIAEFPDRFWAVARERSWYITPNSTQQQTGPALGPALSRLALRS